MPLSSFHRRPIHQLQDVLMAHADALIDGTLDVDTLLEQADWSTRDQIENLLVLAERISQALVTVTPSDQFVTQLQRELNETSVEAPLSWWEHVRQLSPRTQWAAGIGGATLTAGVVLIVTRPLLDVLGGWRSRRVVTTA